MHVTDILVHHFIWLFVAMTTAQLTLDEGGLGGPDCSVLWCAAQSPTWATTG